MRLEPTLAIVFSLCWLGSLVAVFADLPAAGFPGLGLYALYVLAASGGWLCGNVYVARSRKLPRELRRRLLLIYLVGPPGLLYLLHALGPKAARLAAPLAPVYAFAVFAILFLVPVSFRRSRPRR